MRRLLSDLLGLLHERTQPFGAAEVARLRQDFLQLMKNVPKVADYQAAEQLATALKTWRARFDTTIFEQLVKTLPVVIAARIGEHRHDLEAWIKRWEGQIRKDCWTLSINLAPPFDRVGTDYARKYYAGRTPETAFAEFASKRDKWAAKVKRAAVQAWKTLNEYLTWLAGWGDPNDPEGVHTIHVPSDEIQSIEGFAVRVYGADTDDRSDKVLAVFKEALQRYRSQAARIFPWVVRNQLPLELRFDCGLDYGGRYEGKHIQVCAFSVDHPDETVRVLAHEMGHHVWRVYLGAAGHEFWSLAIRKDRGEIDLVKLAELWRQHAPTGHLSDLETHLRSDPLLYLQVETLTHGHGNLGQSVFFSLSDLDELIAAGTRSYSVPNNPITAYASKNEEEAFCEAFGMLVAYGQRALYPLVRSWLRIVLPELRLEQMSAIRSDVARLREALL